MIELSTLDKTILSALTADPFASNASVAKTLDVDLNTVSNRIRTLERKKVSRILAVLNLSYFNQSLGFIYIKVRGRRISDVAHDISEVPDVLMVSELYGGSYDLLVLLKFSNITALSATLDGSILSISGIHQSRCDLVIDKPIFRLEYVTFLPSYFSLSPEENLERLERDIPKDFCDEADLRIIAQLLHNAHRSISKISQSLDIKPSTIRYRIKSLESSGMLRFIRVIDNVAVGISTFTLLEIQVDVVRMDQVITLLREKPWLPQLYRCSGPAPLVGIILTGGIDRALSIKEELQEIPGITDVSLSCINRTFKNDYRWIQKAD